MVGAINVGSVCQRVPTKTADAHHSDNTLTRRTYCDNFIIIVSRFSNSSR